MLVNANPARTAIAIKFLRWNQGFIIPPWFGASYITES
jgi:hypothetical protein